MFGLFFLIVVFFAHVIFKSFAQGAGAAQAYSQNAVGYTKVDVDSLVIIGVQFCEIGGGVITTKNVLPENMDPLDTLRFWNGNTYDEVFYYDYDVWGGVYVDDVNWEELGPGFGDANQIAVYVPIASGSAFWTKSKNNKSKITVFGEVPATNSVKFSAGLSLVSGTFPVKTKIKTIVAEGLQPLDTISFWNGSKYEEVFYYDYDVWGGVYVDNVNWEELGPGFGDANQIVTTLEIPEGKGFWVKTKGSGGTLTFPIVPIN